MVDPKRKATPAERGPHRATPEHGTHDTWYYAERDGLWVIAELRNPDGSHVGTTMSRLTKAQVRRALELMERP